MPLHGYFDYNATTPVCDEAVQALRLAETEFANPSGKYALAKKAKEALALAREQVARMVNSGSDEIAFTSGGTEANNWAIKGVLAAQGAFGRRAEPAHVIVSAIEHASVLEVASYLERIFDCEVTRLKPDAEGKVSASTVAAALKSNTRLVSVMLVNNEVGTLQPVRQIAALLRERGIHFHVDGVQAVGKIHVDVRELGMDTMSFAAHKFYGPKGVGGLFVRRGVRLEPLLHGGGQEGGTRGGTEAVASIAAMGAAAEATQRMLRKWCCGCRDSGRSCAGCWSSAFRASRSTVLRIRMPRRPTHLASASPAFGLRRWRRCWTRCTASRSRWDPLAATTNSLRCRMSCSPWVCPRRRSGARCG